MERRLSAILAADVVAYSRLMEADEEGTHARLKSLREQLIDPSVDRHNGRIVKLTGDGSLVEFPSVVQAVQCAIEIQRGLAERNEGTPEPEQIVFRIGINLGDVIIEADDIYGGGVNVAARLEGLADPGGILISGTAYDQVEGRLDCGFAFLGEKEVKNIERPVRVYRVLLDGAGNAVPLPVARSSRRWWAGAAIGALALLVIAGGAWLFPRAPDEGEAPQAPLDPHRIAVLPLDNISASEDDAYFAEGMTEELIAQLSKIGDLSVIARTSTMKYKDTEKGVDEIGRELGVGTILEGSVRKAGDHVRITLQLIDVTNQDHLWSENYDRPFEGIFAIQSDIAEQVADALQITLLVGEREQIEDHGTDDIEAYELYLRGLYFYNRWTKEGASKAKSYLEQAVQRDPDFAEAHAKLADLHRQALITDYTSPEQRWAEWRGAVDKALELDDTLAEAHTALATYKMTVEWDWDGAERSLRRAIALNPSYAQAHQFIGHHLLSAARRQHDEAIVELRKAVELDPWSSTVQQSLGFGYYHAERYGEAIAQFRMVEEMFPDAPFLYTGLGQSLALLGRFDEAVIEAEKGAEVAPDNDFIKGLLAWTYGIAGRLEEARAVIEGLEAKAVEKPVPAMAMAWAYTGVGDKGRALEWLEKGYQKRDVAMFYMQGPDFRQLLADEPHYQELRRKLKLGGPES